MNFEGSRLVTRGLADHHLLNKATGDGNEWLYRVRIHTAAHIKQDERHDLPNRLRIDLFAQLDRTHGDVRLDSRQRCELCRQFGLLQVGIQLLGL
ncbi:hypothetical protein [Agrobacterium sp. T29]|uniref:hypothetical protein n=1 Tax=Agrobacterium sp. T29 TaxID=2580515 RepID=UPI00115C52F2|nr:hypothetical protein [Agrobacterium sp. T29]